MKKMIIIIMVLVLLLSSNIYAKSPFYEEREEQANIYYELFNNDKYINKVDALAFITNIYDLNVCYNLENDASLVSSHASTNNRGQISEVGFIAADVTSDNNVDYTDSNEILNKVLDSTYQLPVYNKLG